MFNEIFSLYYKLILKYCRAKLNGNMTAAEDVAQEVFLALYRKRNRINMGENIKAWLYKAADYEIKNYIRKNPSFVPMEDCPEELLAMDERFPSLNEESFDCLTDEERALLIGYYNSDDKKEFAKSREMSLNAVSIRICRIRRKLSESLSEINKSGT